MFKMIIKRYLRRFPSLPDGIWYIVENKTITASEAITFRGKYYTFHFKNEPKDFIFSFATKHGKINLQSQTF